MTPELGQFIGTLRQLQEALDDCEESGSLPDEMSDWLATQVKAMRWRTQRWLENKGGWKDGLGETHGM